MLPGSGAAESDAADTQDAVDFEKVNRDIAEICDEIGNLFLNQGWMEADRKAKGYFLRALRIREQMAKENGKTDAEQDLLISCRNLGDECLFAVNNTPRLFSNS